MAFADVHDGVRARRRSDPQQGRSAWVLSPQNALAFNMLFDRPKDWWDIERLVVFQGDRLDPATIRSAFEAWAGEGDQRWDRFEQIRLAAEKAD